MATVPPASWRASAGHRIASPSYAWYWRPMGDTLAGVVLAMPLGDKNVR